MNVKRIFISSIVATSFVGMIGLAYAQSTSGNGGQTGPADTARNDLKTPPSPMKSTMPANNPANPSAAYPSATNPSATNPAMTPAEAPANRQDTMGSGTRMQNDGSPVMAERAARPDRN